MGSRDGSLAFIRDDAHVITIQINQEADEGWDLIIHGPRKAQSLEHAHLGEVLGMARLTWFLICSSSLLTGKLFSTFFKHLSGVVSISTALQSD